MKKILFSVVVHSLWVIWIERNKRYFDSVSSPLSSLINIIISEVHLSVKLVLAQGAFNMTDYNVARLFNLPISTSIVRAPIEIVWCSPPPGCIKFNIDRSSFGSPAAGSIGIVIRDS